MSGDPHWSHPAAAAFLAIFLSEWGDPGQIAAATMTARYGGPWIVWIASTAAMMTKGCFGLLIGTGLRRWAPRSAVRTVAVAVCVLMAILAFSEAEFQRAGSSVSLRGLRSPTSPLNVLCR